MNKKMIALAVAAAMPMAAAQAAPTVYGVAQAEIADYSVEVSGVSADARSMTDKGAGRIGVKGSEDLGNGLSAVYNLEWGVDTSAGGASTASRTGIVGLKGSFGEVTFGRQTAAFAKTNLDGMWTATELEARGTAAQIGSASGFGNGGFISDTINYANKFGPVMFRATIAAGDTDATKDDNSFSVDYSDGPLRVVAAVSNDGNGTADVSRTKIGAAYKLGAWKFTAQMESEDLDTGAAGETDFTMLMADFKMGKNTFTARIGNADTDGFETDHTMVGVMHAFSKSTTAWVGISNNDDDDDDSADITSVGMRVKF